MILVPFLDSAKARSYPFLVRVCPLSLCPLLPPGSSPRFLCWLVALHGLYFGRSPLFASPLMAGVVLFGRVLFLLPLLPGYRGYSSAQSPIFSPWLH